MSPLFSPFDPPPPPTQALTVSQLSAEIKGLLEAGFPRVWLNGEISNFRPASSGHWYFSLKDEGAMIQAVLFRNRQAGVRFMPAEGMQVSVRGSLDLYEKRGSYQVICESMEQAGDGRLLLMLEERKRRLAAEGLFDPGRKRPLPRLPKRVAVVTSPSGAAIRDILQVLNRRAGGLDVVILPAAVQGAEAAKALARQIECANRHGLGEVIILGRGGGSMEDLLPFSEEILVRAVAASAIPVVSAVGHETDSCLCDLAADLRAPTPSAAAELVSAARGEMRDRVMAAAQAMVQAWKSQTRHARQTIRPFSPEFLETSFRVFLQPRMQALDDAKEALLRGMADQLRDLRHRLERQKTSLDALSPKAVLGRGYAMVSHGGHLLESKAQAERSLAPEAELSIIWHDGAILTRLAKDQAGGEAAPGTKESLT